MTTQRQPSRMTGSRRWLLQGAMVAWVAVAAAAPAAQAGETYRYKDPFGIWRSMVVPKGMAKHFKRAQARAGPPGGSAVRRCADCARRYPVGEPAGATSGRVNQARVAALIAHRGLDDFRAVISKAAADYNLDRALLSAVIAIESGFRTDARSPKGALGLMQLMPDTAAELMGAADLERALVDPATNVRVGSRHLRSLIDQYPGRLDLALAAYNAGQGAVQKYDGIPPYAETQQYVRDVIALYSRYKAER